MTQAHVVDGSGVVCQRVEGNELAGAFARSEWSGLEPTTGDELQGSTNPSNCLRLGLQSESAEFRYRLQDVGRRATVIDCTP
jgi:hypothetical protein